jgi:hypothetical protein
MQLCHGYDQDNFPYVIGQSSLSELFLVNVNTQKRVPLIDLENLVGRNYIYEILQTSKFAATKDALRSKHYTNL